MFFNQAPATSVNSHRSKDENKNAEQRILTGKDSTLAFRSNTKKTVLGDLKNTQLVTTTPSTSKQQHASKKPFSSIKETPKRHLSEASAQPMLKQRLTEATPKIMINSMPIEVKSGGEELSETIGGIPLEPVDFRSVWAERWIPNDEEINRLIYGPFPPESPAPPTRPATPSFRVPSPHRFDFLDMPDSPLPSPSSLMMEEDDANF